MGKVQSKQGDCFVVNAHFNPVCQLDELSRHSDSSCSDAKPRSNLRLSEMSVSISRDSIIMNQKVGLQDDNNYPLKVVLPQDGVSKRKRSKEDDEKVATPEKAEEERSEKEEKQRQSEEKISCQISTDDLEKQEFSFTLYDFNGHGKVTKDDVAGLVRSIYDALGKSVKLPPSGSKTIKVHLAVSSPDDSSPADTMCSGATDENSSPKQEECELKLEGSESSVHTLSTYISSAVIDKLCKRAPEPEPQKKFCSKKVNDVPNILGEVKTLNTRPQTDMFPDKVIHRQHRYHHHIHHQKPQQNRDHVAECSDRRNHYLDLVGVENCSSKLDCSCYYSAVGALGGMYRDCVCSCKIAEQCRTPHNALAEEPIYDTPLDPAFRKHHVRGNNLFRNHDELFYIHNKNEEDDRLLNLNFDLCDLAPPDDKKKFDWGKDDDNDRVEEPAGFYSHQHHRRRSKSYDVYDKNQILMSNNSPRSKPKVHHHHHHRLGGQHQINSSAGGAAAALGAIGNSPNHHYRHRHKERDHQRAMQQVANWIEKEHRGGSSGGVGAAHHYANHSPSPSKKHQHYHLHEHVHHHYHHYLDLN